MLPGNIKPIDIRNTNYRQDGGQLESVIPADYSFRISSFGTGRDKLHVHMAFSRTSIRLPHVTEAYKPTFSLKEYASGKVILDHEAIPEFDRGQHIVFDKPNIWVDAAQEHLLTIHAPASTAHVLFINLIKTFNPTLKLTVGRAKSNRAFTRTLGNP